MCGRHVKFFVLRLASCVLGPRRSLARSLALEQARRPFYNTAERAMLPFLACPSAFNFPLFFRGFRVKLCSMKLEIEGPDSAFSALRQAPKGFSACLRLMAAAKLYGIGHLSQERAAELAGQNRQDFLISLSRLGVSPFQEAEDDLASPEIQCPSAAFTTKAPQPILPL